MNYEENVSKEFATIDLLLPSNTRTGRTDAFILAYVKFDKQIRKIFTHLVYQFDAFSHPSEIIEIIAADNRLYPHSFIKGFNALYKIPFVEITGEDFEKFISDDSARLTDYRNKILHGQLTGESLSKEQLANEVALIRKQILLIAEKMSAEIGYDGIAPNSLRAVVKSIYGIAATGKPT